MSRLDEVQVGDRLVLVPPFNKPIREVSVERLTKTQLVADGCNYSKRTGHRVGSGGFSSTFVRLPADGEFASIKCREYREGMVRRLINAEWLSLPDEALERAVAILQEVGQEKGT